MSFDDFVTDRVTLIKRSGERVPDIPASVQRNKIFVNDSSLLIEPGDLLERVASNGLRETYEVVDPAFHEEFHGIAALYQITVRRAVDTPARPAAVSTEDWDAFISHASEDKELFVRPLDEALRNKGLKIWYDEFALTVGDSLRRSIDRGLACSRFGIVVLSPSFFAKEWPQKELDGLVAREVYGQKVILPVWHGVDADVIRKFSPLLADRVAVSSANGIEAVVQALITAMSGDKLKGFSKSLPVKEQKPSSMSVDSILQLIGNSTPSDWSYYDPQAKYYFKSDVQLTIDRHPAADNQFPEPWAHRFPDQSAHAVKFTISYGSTPIKDFWAVEVDGGRSYIPFPKSPAVLTINRWEYAVGTIISIANGTHKFHDYFQRAGFSVVDE